MEFSVYTGIGIAAVVAIGLIWSVAVMSHGPVAGAEMKSAAVIQPYESRARADSSCRSAQGGHARRLTRRVRWPLERRY